MPEPVVSTFPWDLQLPNPAPPLALSHAPVDIRELPESAGTTAVDPLSAADAAGSSTLRGAPEHPPLCRCEDCHFAKTTACGGGHSRHRAAERLHQPGALDMIDSGSGGGIRPGSGAVLMDAAARGTYGGTRWGVNPTPSAVEVAWGLGGRSGSGGGGGYLASRKMEEMNRGSAPPCDTLVPPGPHAPAYNVVPVNPRSMLHAPLGGSSDRFASPDFKSLSMSGNSFSADGMSFPSREARAKRARMTKREGGHLSSDGIGMIGGESAFGQRLDRGGGAGRGEPRRPEAGRGGRRRGAHDGTKEDPGQQPEVPSRR